MNKLYLLQAYFQPKSGAPHEKVSIDQLRDRVGTELASRAILSADDRIREKNPDKMLPEVRAFYERGGRQVIVANLTNRGNIYIEAVEQPERRIAQ